MKIRVECGIYLYVGREGKLMCRSMSSQEQRYKLGMEIKRKLLIIKTTGFRKKFLR